MKALSLIEAKIVKFELGGGHRKCHMMIWKNFWMNIIGMMDLKYQKRF